MLSVSVACFSSRSWMRALAARVCIFLPSGRRSTSIFFDFPVTTPGTSYSISTSSCCTDPRMIANQLLRRLQNRVPGLGDCWIASGGGRLSPFAAGPSLESSRSGRESELSPIPDVLVLSVVYKTFQLTLRTRIGEREMLPIML